MLSPPSADSAFMPRYAPLPRHLHRRHGERRGAAAAIAPRAPPPFITPGDTISLGQIRFFTFRCCCRFSPFFAMLAFLSAFDFSPLMPVIAAAVIASSRDSSPSREPIFRLAASDAS